MGLLLPQRDVVRVIGIDPGNSKLGLAVVEMEWDSGKKRIIAAETFIGNAGIEEDHYLVLHRSDRYVRQHNLMKQIMQHLELYAPDAVAAETPFLHRQPQAFEALVELFLMIRITLEKYNLNTPFYRISPREAKKAVKVDDVKDKEAIARALLKMDLGNKELVNTMDEHSRDAVAIAVTLLLKYEEHVK